MATRMAAEIAAEMAIGTFRPIYEQFDPMRLGDNQRSNLIAHQYGDRIRTENVKPDTLERLISDYPSHSFVIDRTEAKELFHCVRGPSDAESAVERLFRVTTDSLAELTEPIIRFLCVDEIDKKGNCDDESENDTGETGEVPGEAEPDHRAISQQNQSNDEEDDGEEALQANRSGVPQP